MTSRHIDGPAVVLDAQACARLDPFLMRALVDTQRRDAGIPASVREIVADIHQVARQLRTSVLVEPGSATTGSVIDAELPAWGPEERLSTAQAARLVGVTPAYMRRLFHRGDLPATPVHGGGYEVNAVVLALWMAERQQQREGRVHGRAPERRVLQRR